MRAVISFILGLLAGSLLGGGAVLWHQRRCHEAAERAVATWHRSRRASSSRTAAESAFRKLAGEERRQRPEERRN